MVSKYAVLLSIISIFIAVGISKGSTISYRLEELHYLDDYGMGCEQFFSNGIGVQTSCTCDYWSGKPWGCGKSGSGGFSIDYNGVSAYYAYVCHYSSGSLINDYVTGYNKSDDTITITREFDTSYDPYAGICNYIYTNDMYITKIGVGSSWSTDPYRVYSVQLLNKYFISKTNNTVYPFNGTKIWQSYEDWDGQQYNFLGTVYGIDNSCSGYSHSTKSYDGDNKYYLNLDVNYPCSIDVSFGHVNDYNESNSSYMFESALELYVNRSVIGTSFSVTFDVRYYPSGYASYKYAFMNNGSIVYSFYWNGNPIYSKIIGDQLTTDSGYYHIKLIRWHRDNVLDLVVGYPDGKAYEYYHTIPNDYVDYTYNNIKSVDYTFHVDVNQNGNYEVARFDNFAVVTVRPEDTFIMVYPSFNKVDFVMNANATDKQPLFVYWNDGKRVKYEDGLVHTDVMSTHPFEVYAYLDHVSSEYSIKYAVNNVSTTPDSFITLTDSPQLMFTHSFNYYLTRHRMYEFFRADVGNVPAGSYFANGITVLYSIV